MTVGKRQLGSVEEIKTLILSGGQLSVSILRPVPLSWYLFVSLMQF